MRLRLRFLLICLLGLSATLALLAQAERPAVEAPPPPQPIPFNHKVHVGFGIKCLNCHALKEPGAYAGYPKENLCMTCHETIKSDSPAIQKLAEHAKMGKPIPWVKIYKVPEYVWFSHQAHHKGAAIECETCHGPVAEREVIVNERPTSMQSCMACHAKRGASNDCGFCHNPN